MDTNILIIITAAIAVVSFITNRCASAWNYPWHPFSDTYEFIEHVSGLIFTISLCVILLAGIALLTGWS